MDLQPVVDRDIDTSLVDDVITSEAAPLKELGEHIDADPLDAYGKDAELVSVDLGGEIFQHLLYRLDGKWWVSNMMRPYPMCADTKEDARQLLINEYAGLANFKANEDAWRK